MGIAAACMSAEVAEAVKSEAVLSAAFACMSSAPVCMDAAAIMVGDPVGAELTSCAESSSIESGIDSRTCCDVALGIQSGCRTTGTGVV